ncbi:MAG TPA: PAS domain-containing protein [Thermoguttaceae bacterium]|nr:PAS domain-containing protein [Thermoguttaceae bacterium]
MSETTTQSEPGSTAEKAGGSAREVQRRTVELAEALAALQAEVAERMQLEEKLRRANEDLETRVRRRAKEVAVERQRLYDVLETLPVYVVLLTPDYHVPFANRFFRERFGESNGKRCYEYLFNLTEPCDNCRTYDVMKTGQPQQWDWLGPDGRNYDIHDYPFRDTDGSMLILEMGIDVTEEKQARESLRRTVEYARSLIEASLDPLVTISPDGKITDVNEATVKATGLPRDELVGTDFSSYFTEPEQALAGYRQVFAEGRVTDYPLTIRHKDGRQMDVLYNAAVYTDGDDEVLGVFAAARDVTERKRAEAAAQFQRRRFFDVLETLPAMICLLTADHHVAFANRAFRDKFGESRGRHCYEYCFGGAEPCEFCEAYRVLETGRPHHWEVTLPDGAVIDVHNFPFTDADGSPMILEMNLDITEQRRAEAELKVYQEHLEDLIEARTSELSRLNETLEQQVAERTAVAERRAHDLSRLAAELNEAEHRERRRLAALLHDDLQQLLLAVKLRLPSLVEGDPSQLAHHVEKLDELVSECLGTSRNLTQELSPPVIQHGTLADVVRWLGGWFGDKHGLKVDVELDGKLPPTPEHLRVFFFQATRELLTNAVKHSGSMEARVILSCRDGRLTVQIEDGGSRFDPAAVEAYLQCPESFGLFNIRQRLEALGGRLEMEATVRGGACMRLVVPLVECAAPPLDRAESPEIAPPPAHAAKPRAEGRLARLLVVDDHAIVREGLVGLLDFQSDMEVVGEAIDGEHAIQQAELLLPDAIVMDIDMPNLNGIEATRRIKARRPDVVVIGLSLHEEPSAIRAMVEAGADAYVSKHAPAGELVAVIRRACAAGADELPEEFLSP